MHDNKEFDSVYKTENIPITEQFWNYMEDYWHNNREFPENIETHLNRKADLIDGKVPASQLPDIAGNDTLEDVMLRGNDTTKPIVFHKTENRAGELYFNPATYSMSWGGINPNHTGSLNIAVGYNSLANLTTSTNNIALGHYALESLTTGVNNIGIGTVSGQKITTGKWNTLLGAFSGSKISVANYNTFVGSSAGLETTTGNQNTFIGDESGTKNITGTDNTFLGVSAGYWLKNGTSNTFLGSLAGVQHGKPTSSGAWGWNTFVGFNAGTTTHAMGTYGDNNVVIGANAPLGPESNMLVIHSMTSARRHDQTQPFIKGSFTDKWLDFDSSLRVLRLPQADASYTKNLVAKPDGTFGLEEKSNLEGIPLSGTQVGKPVSGKVEFSTNASIESGIAVMRMEDGYISFRSGLSTGITISQNQVFIRQGTEKYINMSKELNKIIIGSTGSGLDGANYYGDSYEENSFVQKKYVDQKSSYSNNEEANGGKWIDGKPIYKKTVKFDTIPSNGEIDLTSHFPDVETIVSNQMFTEWYNIDVAFAGNQYRSKAFITLQPAVVKIELVPNIDYDYSLIDSFTLTLEYTKRTI